MDHLEKIPLHVGILNHKMDAERVSVHTKAVTRYFQPPRISFTQNCWVGDLLANREYKIRVWSSIVIVSLLVLAVPLNTLTVSFPCTSLTRFAKLARTLWPTAPSSRGNLA